jgi:hypothetical protein
MNNILSNSGSMQFKTLITSVKNIVPTESNIVSLNNLIKVLTDKKNEFNNDLNSPNASEGRKNTIKTYLDDIHQVINLTEERINVINNPAGGRKRKSIRKRKSLKRRKTSRKRRSSRRRHY